MTGRPYRGFILARDMCRNVLTRTSSTKLPQHYIMVYAGPPPPSGTVHWMFWVGSLMSQALQCRQFCALMCSRSCPPSSAVYS